MVDEAHTVETEEQAAAAPLPVQLLDEGGGGAASRTTGGALCAGRSRLWRGRARLVARRQLEGRRRLVQLGDERRRQQLGDERRQQQHGDELRRQTRVSGERPTLIPTTSAATARTHPQDERRRQTVGVGDLGGDYLKKWR
jgi:hypothetical protein